MEPTRPLEKLGPEHRERIRALGEHRKLRAGGILLEEGQDGRTGVTRNPVELEAYAHELERLTARIQREVAGVGPRSWGDGVDSNTFSSNPAPDHRALPSRGVRERNDR